MPKPSDERPPVVVQMMIPAADMDVLVEIMRTAGVSTLAGATQLAWWNLARHLDIDILTPHHFTLSKAYPTHRSDL